MTHGEITSGDALTLLGAIQPEYNPSLLLKMMSPYRQRPVKNDQLID